MKKSELATGLSRSGSPPTLRRSDRNPARPPFGQRPHESPAGAPPIRHPFESRLTSRPAPLSVIVVAGDPDEAARIIVASRLTYGGYRLRLAGTGDELLREARGDDVGLVIAEVDLPCAGGPCAIEVLKRTPELRHIPVLAYSARARSADEARASMADQFIGDAAHLRGVVDIVASIHELAAGVGEVGGRR